MIERNLDNATDTQIKADQIFGKGRLHQHVEMWISGKKRAAKKQK